MAVQKLGLSPPPLREKKSGHQRLDDASSTLDLIILKHRLRVHTFPWQDLPVETPCDFSSGHKRLQYALQRGLPTCWCW